MSRRAKQMLAADARKAAENDSFVPVLLLSEVDPSTCNPGQYLELLKTIDELYSQKPIEQRTEYVEKIYRRMLELLSHKVEIAFDRIVAVIKYVIIHQPTIAIVTNDDLKQYNVQMERRSVIIHFDMSGSMAGSGFDPLVRTIVTLCTKLQNQGVPVHVSLFGGRVQEAVHTAIGGRLLTLDEFSRGNYRPQGGTAFCPSFARSGQFPTAYDAIIISDGDFTDDISRLTFQEQCKTVFFVAPPWSPVGVEERHAKTISNCVHPNVPYIGIAAEKYSQLDTIIEGFLRDHHSFVRLSGYFHVGMYAFPSYLLAPSQMRELFTSCHQQGEDQLQNLIKKMLGVFRYLEETAKINFERCIRGEEFRNLMSLVTPLTKMAEAHLEESQACQQLYGYLVKILATCNSEHQRLLKRMANDPKAQAELTAFWDEAMSFNEKGLIMEENDRKYGPPIGYLNLRMASLTCPVEMVSEALQQLKTIYSPEDFDLLSIVLDLLSSAKIDEKLTTGPPEASILIWRQSDGTVDLLSILRQLPCCLQQYQHLRSVRCSHLWTLQPLAALRLAWIMEASNRTFPEFITKALPSLLTPNKFLIDLDQDENRAAFWMKVIRLLTPKINLPETTLQTINHILTVHALKNVSLRLTDDSISYEKPVYGDAVPFIDTDEPMAWCTFINEGGNRVHPRTGQVAERMNFITDPHQVERYYAMNLAKHGSVVRPRYLTQMECTSLPPGAIELYNSGMRKDVDILREQLTELFGSTQGNNQIDAHIYTIRDRLKTIPSVVWDNKESIKQTIEHAKATCQSATLPTEKITVNIPRSIIIDYCLAHCKDPFTIGAMRGFENYSRVSTQPSLAGMSQIDYAIDCGERNVANAVTDATVQFQHLDKPGVNECLEKHRKRFSRTLRSVMNPPQFQSLPALLAQAKQNSDTNEILGMADLEAIPATTTTESTSAPAGPQVRLNSDFFTCPITLDIMEDPATTTPCGHMFEKVAIEGYLRTVGALCPICRAAVTNITPNFTFKHVIQAWLAQQDS